jgi:hypothetical protein
MKNILILIFFLIYFRCVVFINIGLYKYFACGIKSIKKNRNVTLWLEKIILLFSEIEVDQLYNLDQAKYLS